MFLENTLFSIFFYYLKCFSIYFIWKTGNCFFFLKQLQNMYLFSMHATSWLTILIAFFIITTSSRLIVLWIILRLVDPTLGGPLRGVFLSFKNNTVAITIKTSMIVFQTSLKAFHHLLIQPMILISSSWEQKEKPWDLRLCLCRQVKETWETCHRWGSDES